MSEVGWSVGPNLGLFLVNKCSVIFVLGVGYFAVFLNYIVIILEQLDLQTNLY